ncbi:acyl-CoA thioesterase [Seohaeicola zhoushanensis]|uniref:Acyl-CoA thioesterase n=1 Tax=Seohaeicola zhoushanensis TaxID=1569283 RepID=A0A8J3GVY8_9RHOB|nr:acyl-CoA thioesterase [Seohaeicola zhoushanensis]GHF46030.1 hypothetical protein GCM10017056_17110 [Seohaeicola zhoushanensis]
MQLRYHTPLPPEEQLAQGLDAAQPMALADRVRFAELDSQNHVNNKAYLGWFETVRVIYGETFLLPHFDLRPRILVHSLNLRYLREMLRDEDYICTARIAAFRNSSYTMDQQIWSAGALRARMSVIVVLGHPDGEGRLILPDALKAELIARDKALDESA